MTAAYEPGDPVFEAQLAAAAARPAIDLRPLLDPTMLTQGPRPMCVPFTLSLGHEAARAANRPSLPTAPEAIWWHCINRSQVTGRGMLLKDGAEALASTGQPPLNTWPYNPTLGVGTENPPAKAGPQPWPTARTIVMAPANNGIEDDIESLLATGHPVVLIVELTYEFEHPDAYGHIAVPDLRVPPGDYHAVLAVGAETHPIHGRCLLIRNSWGPGWGAGGYGWLPSAYLIAFGPQAAVVD